MAGKRHHTIPQFLLRGFASSQRGDETKVWMYRKGKPGVELNIVNVAVEQYFYGKPDETDLDERITDLEDDLAPLVESLRDGSGTVGLISDDRIPFLVAHLSFRTRHLRESAIGVMDSFMGKTEHVLTQKDILITLIAKELATEGSTSRELMSYYCSTPRVCLQKSLMMRCACSNRNGRQSRRISSRRRATSTVGPSLKSLLLVKRCFVQGCAAGLSTHSQRISRWKAGWRCMLRTVGFVALRPFP